jgi:hypothetical protein
VLHGALLLDLFQTIASGQSVSKEFGVPLEVVEHLDRAFAQVDENPDAWTGCTDATIMGFSPAAHLALCGDFLDATDQGR